MHPNLPALVRIPVFGALLVFSLIVLGVDAHLISQASFTILGVHYSLAPSWLKLGVAVAVITIVSLVAILVMDLLRKGAVTSFISVELGWLGVLWVLWLATAADTANGVQCSGVIDGFDGSICGQAQAAEAFSFLAWLLLMAYWILLLVFAIIAATQGQPGIWMVNVADADFSAGSGARGTGGGVQGGPAYGAPAQQPYYAPQQQQQQLMTGASNGATVTYPPHPNVQV